MPTLRNASKKELGLAVLSAEDRAAWNERQRKGEVPRLICPWCKESFLPLRYWQKFCSPEHRNAQHNAEKYDAVAALKRELERLKLRNKELQNELNARRRNRNT